MEINKVTFDEAALMLKLTGDSLMANNLNWDFISIVKDQSEQNQYYFLTGAYDFELEKERWPKLFPQDRIDDNIIYIELPLIQSTIFLNHNNTEEMSQNNRNVLVEIIPVSFHDRARNKKDDLRLNDTRMMGDRIAHKDYYMDSGRLGTFIKSTSGSIFIITACHVVDDPSEFRHAKLGEVIKSPPVRDDSEGLYTIGKLFWQCHDNYHDIALIWVSNEDRIAKGNSCGISIKPTFSSKVAYGDLVSICTSDASEKKIGKVKSQLCFKRKSKNKEGILKNLIQTESIARPGDSGSIVVNQANEAVGLLVKDKGVEFSYFMKLDILKKKIVDVPMGIKQVDFEFETFL